MTNSLIDDLGGLASPDLLTRLGSTFGESEQNVARGMKAGTTSLLAGLVGRTGDATVMQKTFALVTDPASEQTLDNPTALIESISTGGESTAMSLGDRFSASVFGGRTAAVTDVIARSSGLRGGLVSTLIRVAAPLVLGMLARRVRTGGLDANGFGSLLNSERDSILRAAPPGLKEALSREREVPLEGDRLREPAARAADRVPRSPPELTEPHKKRKVWPFVATLAALGLLWVALPKRDRNVSPTETLPAPVAGPTAVAGGEVTPVPGATRLPNGDELNLPEGGMESRLVGFITAPSAGVNDTTWFEFDQLVFEPGSATIKSESNAQLANLSRILKGYPSVSAKIGGYTDNVGNDAANKRLSQQRADAVREALVGRGIDGKRLTAEGYGEKHPVADNSTEEGRSRNRRIAIRVTAK